MGDIVPRNQLVKQGFKGFAGVGGGVALLILRGIAHIDSGLSLPGLIVGGIVSVVGVVIASSPEDRKAGMVALGAGILTAVASLPGIGGIASWLMMVGGIGLILTGGWSLFKFWRALRKRRG
jgi:hypothetical protein